MVKLGQYPHINNIRSIHIGDNMPRKPLSSEFLDYLAATNYQEIPDHLPTLNELSKQLKISVARLREQLEVAKALGLVEARPRTGLRRLPYSFLPAVRQSLAYAIEIDPHNFNVFAELRDQIERAYWKEAVMLLTAEDKVALQALVDKAWKKLKAARVQIPHEEHKELHLLIYSRLNNPFVNGLLEAYWEAYESVGQSIFGDYEYLLKIWEYHQKMIDSICRNQIEEGYQALVEHRSVIHHKSVPDLNILSDLSAPQA
jgi:DNA-binding FadR family transcriptional regulator